MSVVNRMLQDIDARLGTAGVAAHHPDVRTVPARTAPGPPRLRSAVLVLVAAAAIALAALWLNTRQPPAAPVSAGAMTPAPSPVLMVTTSAPIPQPVSADQVEPVVALSPAPQLRRATIPAPVTENLRLSLRITGEIPDSRPMAPKVAAREPRPAEVRRGELPVRRVAVDETVAVAHALWNDGARHDAVATLREALAAAESNTNPPVIRRLARELARLQLAGDHPQGALEILRRMESLLADDADAWALRGNAAQRLALHTEAASAYLAALRLRPEEGKWMLGAAISLAAEGRTEEAQPWVERARERGAITPAIATYLGQLGILARK